MAWTWEDGDLQVARLTVAPQLTVISLGALQQQLAHTHWLVHKTSCRGLCERRWRKEVVDCSGPSGHWAIACALLLRGVFAECSMELANSVLIVLQPCRRFFGVFHPAGAEVVPSNGMWRTPRAAW